MKTKSPKSTTEAEEPHQEIDGKTYVNEKKLIEAIDVLKKIINKNESKIDDGKQQLFGEDINFVFLQFSLKKMTSNNSTYIHYIPLKYHWRHEINYETCLIVKDKNKEQTTDRETDLDLTRDYYRNILEEHDASELISDILPMRQLITEFKQPALRKKLSNEYNAFLCDRQLLKNKHSFLSRFLGKAFWIDSKKVPILVNLKNENLKQELETKLNQTSLYVSGKGSTLTICIGSLQQDTEKLCGNLLSCLEKIKQLYGENVRELSIKTEKSMAIYFYMDLGSANEIELEKRDKNEMDEFVEEEFDFIPNHNIRVYKDGRVRIVKQNKENNDDEKNDQDDSNEPINTDFIKKINNEPDDEEWTRRLVHNRPQDLRKRKIVHRSMLKKIKKTKK